MSSTRAARLDRPPSYVGVVVNDGSLGWTLLIIVHILFICVINRKKTLRPFYFPCGRLEPGAVTHLPKTDTPTHHGHSHPSRTISTITDTLTHQGHSHRQRTPPPTTDNSTHHEPSPTTDTSTHHGHSHPSTDTHPSRS